MFFTKYADIFIVYLITFILHLVTFIIHFITFILYVRVYTEETILLRNLKFFADYRNRSENNFVVPSK